MQTTIKETATKMNKAVTVVETDLSSLRTGRASTHMLDGIMVNAYGSDSPINQVATVTTPDGMTVMIQPWDKGVLGAIEKAILQANIGLTPNNDGKVVRLNIPPLTEDSRKEIVKRAHGIAEEGRVAVRNIRRHMNDETKRREKDAEFSEDEAKKLLDDIQKMTNGHIKEIDDHLKAKETEIMTV